MSSLSLLQAAREVVAAYSEGTGMIVADSRDGDRLASALAALKGAVDGIPEGHPVADVHWVPIHKVRANDYNPNHVAPVEMDLLATSIRADGYTQPVVTVFNDREGVYEIVDGFHRWLTMAQRADVRKATNALLPVVVIHKPPNERMASTVRHNRARGKHGVGNMASIIFTMLDNGWSEAEVCQQLGMSADEILRLKHVSGFSKLFEGAEYRRAWETKRQARLRREYLAKHPGETVP